MDDINNLLNLNLPTAILRSFSRARERIFFPLNAMALALQLAYSSCIQCGLELITSCTCQLVNLVPRNPKKRSAYDAHLHLDGRGPSAKPSLYTHQWDIRYSANNVYDVCTAKTTYCRIRRSAISMTGTC